MSATLTPDDLLRCFTFLESAPLPKNTIVFVNPSLLAKVIGNKLHGKPYSVGEGEYCVIKNIGEKEQRQRPEGG